MVDKAEKVLRQATKKAMALAVAAHENDTEATRALLAEVLEGEPEARASRIAVLLTTQAQHLAAAFEQTAASKGVDFETVVWIAAHGGYTRLVPSTGPVCRVCGTLVELADPDDPESFVHAQDGDWGDHTAQVA